MPRLSRRALLIGSASLAATPAMGAIASSGYVDVIIVGAGAAGIAAARKLTAAGRRIAIVEAADHVGGRCITDTQTFGVPYDRGAHWIHMPDINPLAKLAAAARMEVYPAPPGQKLRIGRRFAREGEMEQFLSALVRTNRAIGEAARGKTDIACARVLPKELGELRPAVEFVLGPFGCAKDLSDVSAYDFAKSAERDVDAFCRQGLGALLARLADGLPIQLSTRATTVYWSDRSNAQVETTRGWLRAAAVIVTVSTAVLTAEKIKFVPALPRRVLDAADRLTLGSYDHVALELAGNPLGLQSDEMVFEKATDNRTAAVLGNVSGTSLCLVEVAGRFGASLAAQGEAAMVDFAIDWLSDLYGPEVKKAVRRRHATNWAKEPLALGAFSAASVGGQPARRVFMEPANLRLYFAGEAAHETLWGTVGGAWESGERAADVILRRFWAPPSSSRPARAGRRKR
ncbi:MAG TPA: NAD(P)/FAD-dependent oxidoreductase [Xanthobacteraceae bacterium]|nr:NAD(P)/FAD-dependent oxidoreductase [Xanthobacteraceae bacterium]